MSKTNTSDVKELNFKIIKGTVKKLSDSRTVQVLVEGMKINSKYNKSYKTSKCYPSDIKEGFKIAIGDSVLIQECKPISKTKKWFVKEVIS
ncbi:MAG: 30S ribosomal protein S17 [Nitrospina sp.]|jgi:small subunit ribosomal protein S17|nr:30S ribosomal protein S17 [Nitrospina sp.]MBT6120457.1 30S ribosomal protein S17 [bacterium]